MDPESPGSGALPLTGERTVPDVPVENYWFRRHEAAYAYACALVVARQLLEVGCGEGYGTALLASSASTAVGIDYDALTIAHASARYASVDFVRGNLAALPVRAASVDVLVAFQVIEHVWDHPGFVRECQRVLRPRGMLLVTTPNRLTFSPGSDEPVNPFHTKEFTASELIDLLQACGFTITSVGGLHPGRRLAELDRAHGGSFVDAQLDAAPNDWSDELRADVASVGIADFTVLTDNERSVDECLDLVVLAARVDS